MLLRGETAVRHAGGDTQAAPLVRVSPGLINRLVAAVDVVLYVGVALACQHWGPSPLTSLQSLILGTVGAASFVGILVLLRGYHTGRYGRLRWVLTDLVGGIAGSAAAGGLLLLSFAPNALDWSLSILIWAVASLTVLFIGRLACRRVINTARRCGFLRRRVAVIGATRLAARYVEAMAQRVDDYELVGVFDDVGSRPGAGSVGDLRLLAQSCRLDMILLTVPWRDQLRISALTEQVQWISADVALGLDQPDLLARSSMMSDIGGLPTLMLNRHPLRGTQGMIKVAQDYVVAVIGVICVSPILLICAGLLALQGGGPILFRQARVGFNGRPFSIYKFRSMYFDPTDDGSRGAVKNDPRVTKLGAFLRSSSLDELPQLFNVLRGEMSIVGPRPHVPNMIVGEGAYRDVVRAYAARCQIKPGITGWAQINGMRGTIDTLVKARAAVDLDLYYLRNWSVALDFKIMFRTVFRHMAGSQVY
jgi:Undecaprenyl-phosphate glucose phosphotransferase